MGEVDMTSKERVRSALSRAMLDTPRGRGEMASFVLAVVIAAAELAATLDESAEKLFGEILTARSKRLTDDKARPCDNTPCGCLAIAAGWTRAGDEAVEFFDRARSTPQLLGDQ